MVQLLQWQNSLCKHEDMKCWDSGNNLGMMAHACDSNPGEAETEDPGESKKGVMFFFFFPVYYTFENYWQ